MSSTDAKSETCSRRKASLLLISHDLDVVASAVDRVVVLLEGQIVEEATTTHMLEEPLHPFTRAMVASTQIAVGPAGEHSRGPSLRTGGCRFAHACPRTEADCLVVEPILLDAGDGRRVRCPIVLGDTS